MAERRSRCCRSFSRLPRREGDPPRLRPRCTAGVHRVILLDTNILIHYLKGHDSVVARLQSSSPKELGIPSVVAYEIEYGTMKLGSLRRRAVISELLAGLDQVPFDHGAARESAQVRI